MAINRERTSLHVNRERAVLAAVYLPESRFDPRDPLGELRELAETAGATVVGELIQNRQKPESGTYMGVGKLCDETDASLVIFDHDLSPSQIGNIEKRIERKVVDRSELILDIFAGRATTQARAAPRTTTRRARIMLRRDICLSGCRRGPRRLCNSTTGCTRRCH